MSNPLITLLTDFGRADTYVGVMKGVIAQLAPNSRVIDLTHEIAPQDIRAASYHLASAYSHFPVGTVHIVVVDPGVGTQRGAIAFTQSTHTFVGPDNGGFSGVLAQGKPKECVCLDNPTYWYCDHPSRTFHGRDIFAAVGAHASRGIALQHLGTAIAPNALIRLPTLPWEPDSEGGLGTIQAIDHFGNLITNISSSVLEAWSHAPPLRSWQMTLQGWTVPGCRTFGEVEVGAGVAYIGSQGWIELAVNGGSAQSLTQTKVGDRVRLQVMTAACSETASP